MSTKTKNTQDTEHVAIHERLNERKVAAATIREGLELEKRGALMVGEGLVKGEGTFTAGETKELQTWATSVTRKSWKTCLSYIAIAKANASLTTKTEKEKAAAFTFEQGQVLASVPAEHRKAFVKKVARDATPDDARKVRDAIVQAAMSDDEKKAARAKERERETREREQAAEKTVKLADDIRKGVKAAVRKGDVWAAMTFAAMLVNGGRTGEQVAEAIRRVQLDTEAAQRAVAEKDEAEKVAAEKLAELAESRKS